MKNHPLLSLATWFALVGLLACDPPREAVAPSLPPGNPVRQPLEAPQRPDVMRTFPIDYGALPYMLTAGLDAKDKSRSVAFLSDPGQANPRTAILEGMVAEIETEGLRMFTPLSGANVPEVQRLANAPSLVCKPAGPGPVKPKPPAPGAPSVPASPTESQQSISWEGIRTRTWSRDHLDYVRYEGTMETGACKASALRVATVRAQAIVPGLLYGFRTCVPVCDSPPNDPAREEMLVLIGPRAVWAGSSVPWASLQTNPHIGSFSRIVVPLRRGGSASALINVEEHEANRFLDAPSTSLGKESVAVRRNLPITQLAVDVSWLEADSAPFGIGFVSSVAQQNSKSATSLNLGTKYSFDE